MISDKLNIARNLTLSFADDSDKQGSAPRIFQQYFMVQAIFLFDEAIEKEQLTTRLSYSPINGYFG